MTKINFKNLKPLIPILPIIALVAAILVPKTQATQTTANIRVETEIEESVAIIIKPNDNTEITSAGNYVQFSLFPNDFQVGIASIEAFTNDVTGLTVTASLPDGASGNLINTTTNTEKILPLATTGGSTKSSFPLSTETTTDPETGASETKELATWGVAPENSGTFTALGSSASPSSVLSSVTKGTFTTDYQIAIRTATDTIAATYTGSIVFTAVGNYEPGKVLYHGTTPVSDNYYYRTDWTTNKNYTPLDANSENTFHFITVNSTIYDYEQGYQQGDSHLIAYSNNSTLTPNGSFSLYSPYYQNDKDITNEIYNSCIDYSESAPYRYCEDEYVAGLSEVDARYSKTLNITIAREDKASYTIPRTATDANGNSLYDAAKVTSDGNSYENYVGRVFLGWTTNAVKANAISNRLCLTTSGTTILDTNGDALPYGSASCAYSDSSFDADANREDMLAGEYITDISTATNAAHELHLYAVWGGYAIVALGANGNMNFLVASAIDDEGGFTLAADSDETLAGSYSIGDPITDNLGDTTLIYTYYVPPVMFMSEARDGFSNALAANIKKTATLIPTYDNLEQDQNFIYEIDFPIETATTYLYQIFRKNPNLIVYANSFRNTRNSYIPLGLSTADSTKTTTEILPYANRGYISSANFSSSFSAYRPLSTVEWFGYTGSITQEEYQTRSYNKTGIEEETKPSYYATYSATTLQTSTSNYMQVYYFREYNHVTVAPIRRILQGAILVEMDENQTNPTYPYLKYTDSNGNTTYYTDSKWNNSANASGQSENATPFAISTIEKSTAPSIHTARDVALEDHDLYGWTNMGSNKMTSITNFKNLNTDYLLAISGMFACFGWEVEEPFTLDLTDFQPSRIGAEGNIIGVFANAGGYSSNFQITGLSLNLAEFRGSGDPDGKYFMAKDYETYYNRLVLIENFSGTAYSSTNSTIDLSNISIEVTKTGNITTSVSNNSVKDENGNTIYEDSYLALNGNFANSGFTTINLPTYNTHETKYAYYISREFYAAEKLTTINKTGTWLTNLPSVYYSSTNYVYFLTNYSYSEYFTNGGSALSNFNGASKLAHTYTSNDTTTTLTQSSLYNNNELTINTPSDLTGDYASSSYNGGDYSYARTFKQEVLFASYPYEYQVTYRNTNELSYLQCSGEMRTTTFTGKITNIVGLFTCPED